MLAGSLASCTLTKVGRTCVCHAAPQAHCVSTWGHDFRPDYKSLGGVLAGSFAGVPVTALTATATDAVKADVIKTLRMKDPRLFQARAQFEDRFVNYLQVQSSLYCADGHRNGSHESRGDQDAEHEGPAPPPGTHLSPLNFSSMVSSLLGRSLSSMVEPRFDCLPAQVSFYRDNLHLSVVTKQFGKTEDGKPLPFEGLAIFIRCTN